MTKYFTIDDCRDTIFPLIARNMAINEPAPQYAIERSGIESIESIFVLMQRNYYPDLCSKAAYMFCSIIGGHPFSNGNKRLAVALLSYFLLINECGFHSEPIQNLHKEMTILFPQLQWSEVKSFRYPHEYFLYHLALVIADREQKGTISFSEECKAVEEALRKLIKFPHSEKL